MILPWRTISSQPLGDFRVFTVRSELKASPKDGAEHEFFIIDSVNWVNVLALTDDGRVVLIEQFRHGSNTVELEIPGGMIDSADASPVAAGCRELLEETGYVGEGAEVIGQVFPNPAIMSNTCFTVLVRNCRLTGKIHFDATEDIALRLCPLEQVSGLVADGTIQHSLVVAALFHFENWRKQNRV